MLTPVDTRTHLEDPEIRTAYGAEALIYELATVLVALRQQYHLSHADLAARTGVSAAYLAKLERGEANPRLREVGALLATLWHQVRLELCPLISHDAALGGMQAEPSA